MELGGGRTRPDDSIDHAVGLTGLAAVGTRLVAGESLATVHARTSDAAELAATAIRAAYGLGRTAPAASPTVRARVTA